jgi:hypothetical protein
MKPVHLTIVPLMLSPAFSLAQPLVADFDTSIDGWTVETRTSPTGAFTLVSRYTPTYRTMGGDAGGHIEQLDPDSNWSFFASPDAWGGDRSAAYGLDLEYSVRTDTLNYPDGRLVVLTGAGGQRISHATPLPPVGAWSRRSIPIAEGLWFVGSSGTGTPATQAQILTVLGSLQRLLIGMEFGGDALEERVDLNRVRLGSCPADFNGDGFLDFFDYDDFVNCFETGACPPGRSADFNGDGFADFFDYDAFVAAFEAGC